MFSILGFADIRPPVECGHDDKGVAVLKIHKLREMDRLSCRMVDVVGQILRKAHCFDDVPVLSESKASVEKLKMNAAHRTTITRISFNGPPSPQVFASTGREKTVWPKMADESVRSVAGTERCWARRSSSTHSERGRGIVRKLPRWFHPGE